MDSLLSLDRSLFLFINHSPHFLLLDMVALFVSGVGNAGIIWIVLAGILLIREERKNHAFFLQVLGMLTVSWFGVELFLKSLIARPRPSISMGAIIVGNGASWYSFPSGHATVSWAAYVLLSEYEPRWKPYLFTLAVLVSLSRIYLGVHYPLDILAGAFIGWCIGTLTVLLTKPQKLPRSKNVSVRLRRKLNGK